MTFEEMNYKPPKERYRSPLPPETRAKMEAAYIKSLELEEKEIRCPYCHYMVERFYGSAGLFRMLCPRCGATAIIDVQYWRRRHRREGGAHIQCRR